MATEHLGPHDIISSDGKVTLGRRRDGITPVKDQNGKVIGRAIAVKIEKPGSLLIDIELDKPLGGGTSMTFRCPVPLSTEMP